MTHPVINDEGMVLWRALGVSSWPTVAVVSPQGRLLTLLAGEGHERDVDDFVAAALELYGERGYLRDGSVPQVRRCLIQFVAAARTHVRRLRLAIAG